MPAATRLDPSPRLSLSERDESRLRERLEHALARARRSGRRVLAALTVTLPGDVDPVAVVCASRQDGETWQLFEQPDRQRRALAALGEASRIEARGADRFAAAARQWRELIGRGLFDPPQGAGPEGPLALGGFAFAPHGGRDPHWSGFDSGSLVVPEVALSRCGSRVSMTLTALVSPDDTAEERARALSERVGALRERPLPLLDPAPVARSRVVSAMPPEHYEEAVARAVERIGAGTLEKIVLAREVQVHGSVAHDPAGVIAVLREEFPTCFVYLVGRGERAFLGASPELLVRREGLRAATLALAGSTRRSSDPAVDAHLGEQLLRSDKNRGEQAIVARRIEQALRPVSVWVTAAPEPTLVRVANIQHLATPVRAQLHEPIDVLDLLARLHPTPAVGGEPGPTAARMIPALEGLDRGWYAGPVGWTDASGDGEFCVALRCALLAGPLARCYAGAGIVHDSEPASELAETEIKLQAMLPVLLA
ncbi:MAG TPA: isochorismate synthase [Solirubrobacteraceae bacterium]|jgi:salicylate biosynthesis isochorismate synthase/menaquinone-specific isochorismate synthase|nr:isochorismate synthase [Solirubrobacteraceae bacterium]